MKLNQPASFLKTDLLSLFASSWVALQFHSPNHAQRRVPPLHEGPPLAGVPPHVRKCRLPPTRSSAGRQGGL